MAAERIPKPLNERSVVDWIGKLDHGLLSMVSPNWQYKDTKHYSYFLCSLLLEQLVLLVELVPASVGDVVLGSCCGQVHSVVEVTTPEHIVVDIHRTTL